MWVVWLLRKVRPNLFRRFWAHFRGNCWRREEPNENISWMERFCHQKIILKMWEVRSVQVLFSSVFLFRIEWFAKKSLKFVMKLDLKNVSIYILHIVRQILYLNIQYRVLYSCAFMFSVTSNMFNISKTIKHTRTRINATSYKCGFSFSTWKFCL